MWPHKKAKYRAFLNHQPMLLLGDHIYSVATGKVATGKIAATANSFEQLSRNSRVIGSSFDWLIIYNPINVRARVPLQIVLLNPQAAINSLEHSSFCLHMDRVAGFYPVKAVLSADPSRGRDYVVAILFRNNSSPSTCMIILLETIGDRMYIRQMYHGLGHVYDIACLNGVIHWLEKNGPPGTTSTESEGFYVISMSSLRPDRIEFVSYNNDPCPTLIGEYCDAYILEGWKGGGLCGSSIIIYNRIMHDDGTMETLGFEVFEWVHSKEGGAEMLWRRVRNLQNDVIFLGSNSAFRTAGSGLLAADRLEPNCIYYMDDPEIIKTDQNKKRNRATMYPDMGVFDVELDCRRPFPFPEDCKYKQLLKRHRRPPVGSLSNHKKD
ncbi:hypothetical protein CDL15_Pgr005630 [Punica granatum]|nr:hypothetical protein CDL15_Pgr005630 [Punica granatum]